MAQKLFLEANQVSNADPQDTQNPTDFPLGIEGFTYGDLYRPRRLRELAEAFYAGVARQDPALHAALADYLSTRGAQIKGTKAESDLLIAAAPHLSRFVARLFRVEREREALGESIRAQDPVFQLKHFIQRRATKKIPAEKVIHHEVEKARGALDALRRAAFPETLAHDEELGVSLMTVRLLECEAQLKKPDAGRHAGGAWGRQGAPRGE